MSISRKLALELALRTRTCPLSENLGPPEKIKAHLEKCEWCSATVRPWFQLVEKIKEYFPNNEPVDFIAAGHLCRIKDSLARWHGPDFFNPPMVLVLEKLQEPDAVFGVAQVFWGHALAGPGDLVLEPEQSNTVEIFVECWNTYPVQQKYLEPSGIKVDSYVLDAARNLVRDQRTEISWAPLTTPLWDDDPRRDFRRLERIVAGVFGAPAYEAHPHLIDRLALCSGVGSPEKLLKDRRLSRMIEFPSTAKKVAEMLAGAGYLPQALPLAAANRSEDQIPVRHWRFGPDGIAEFSMLKAKIFKVFREEHVCKIAGRIIDLPSVGPQAVICVFADRPGKGFVPASASWNRENGAFMVKGPSFLCDCPGKLLLIAIAEFQGAQAE